MSRKNIALLVNTGLEERGILRFQKGELIWAEYGILRGEEAFFALAAHKNGTVTQQDWHEQIIPNVMQPLSRLIFQALQYRSKYATTQPSAGEQEVAKATSLPGEVDDSPFLVLAEAQKDALVAAVGYEQLVSRGGEDNGVRAWRGYWQARNGGSKQAKNQPMVTAMVHLLRPYLMKGLLLMLRILFLQLYAGLRPVNARIFLPG